MNWSRVEAASCGSETACTNETCSFPVVKRANCRAGLFLACWGKGLVEIKGLVVQKTSKFKTSLCSAAFPCIG